MVFWSSIGVDVTPDLLDNHVSLQCNLLKLLNCLGQVLGVGKRAVWQGGKLIYGQIDKTGR